MRKICKVCDELKDEYQFDMWLPSIGVRKDICRQCERKERIKWWVKEMEKQNKKKPN